MSYEEEQKNDDLWKSVAESLETVYWSESEADTQVPETPGYDSTDNSDPAC